MRQTLLIFLSLLVFNSCIPQDSEVKIEKIINSLKENRTETELATIDKSLQIIKTSAVRDKFNQPNLRISINEIYLNKITNKSYEELVDYAATYLEKNKARIKFLETEIEDRRALLRSNSQVESAQLSDYIINDFENLYITLNFKSASVKAKETGYLFLVILYGIENNEVLQTIGYSNNTTIGIIHSKDSSFNHNQILSQKVVDIVKESGDINFPITDLSYYNIGIKSYVAQFEEAYDGPYKPRNEDDFKSKKSLDELKKDLMKLKTLVNSLELSENSF